MASSYKTAAPAGTIASQSTASFGLPDLNSVDRNSLAHVAKLQAQKIDVLQRQVGTLVQSVAGISASWFNDQQAYDENSARILLEYLHACRPISADIEELFRAVYYSAGGVARRREAPVPPPPFEVAPAPFRMSEGGTEETPDTLVVKQGDYWRASVAVNPISGASAHETAGRVRALLAERVFSVTMRRIDVYPAHGMIGNLKTVTICVYDSDDPSAKKSAQCLKDLCDLLNESALTVSPTGALATMNQLLRLDTLTFVGLAADLATVYSEMKGLKKPTHPVDVGERHWRRHDLSA
jgi:hypothetical protein